MPVKIGSFEPLSEEEFSALAQRKARKTNPVMEDLLEQVAAGQPMRVPLEEEQSARGLRTAISRAATGRGLTVETLEGEGFVAVRLAKERPARRGRQATDGSGKRRRGRPPKRQAENEAEIASLQDLAAGES